MEYSEEQNIITSWFVWHFCEMPKFLFSAWKNYILFGINSFSIPLLFKTLFSPWRKYKWRYPKIFDIKEFFSTLISNIFSRFLGAICRVILIIAGLVFQFFVLIAGFSAILFWFLMPFLIIAGILFAFIL